MTSSPVGSLPWQGPEAEVGSYKTGTRGRSHSTHSARRQKPLDSALQVAKDSPPNPHWSYTLPLGNQSSHIPGHTFLVSDPASHHPHSFPAWGPLPRRLLPATVVVVVGQSGCWRPLCSRIEPLGLAPPGTPPTQKNVILSGGGEVSSTFLQIWPTPNWKDFREELVLSICAMALWPCSLWCTVQENRCCPPKSDEQE